MCRNCARSSVLLLRKLPPMWLVWSAKRRLWKACWSSTSSVCSSGYVRDPVLGRVCRLGDHTLLLVPQTKQLEDTEERLARVTGQRDELQTNLEAKQAEADKLSDTVDVSQLSASRCQATVPTHAPPTVCLHAMCGATGHAREAVRSTDGVC